VITFARFKDFESSRPFKLKQGVLVGIFDIAQTLLAPGVAVGILYLTLMVQGGALDPGSPLLIVMALLSWLLFKPTQERRSPLIPARMSAVADVMLRWTLLLSVLWVIGRFDLDSSLQDYSESVRLSWGLATPLVLLGARLALQTLRRRFLIRTTHRRSVVIAGYNAGGLQLASRLKRDLGLGLDVVGFFDDRYEVRTLRPVF
jgi:putative colanic acid biosynthesis UDP-glucose lipid carrier transferase